MRVRFYGLKERGKKISLEVRAKQSVAMRGRKATKPPWNLGKTHATDPRIYVGPKHDEAARKKMSDAAKRRPTGPASPMWRGGKVVGIEAVRLRLDVKRWVRKIHKKFGGICWLCGGSKSLDAHHIYPVRIWPEWAAVETNGVLLCRKCHRRYEHSPGIFDRLIHPYDYEPFVGPGDNEYGGGGLGDVPWCHDSTLLSRIKDWK